MKAARFENMKGIIEDYKFDILMGQEPIGAKLEGKKGGYRKRRDTEYGIMDNLERVANDLYGMTSIEINPDKIIEYCIIPFEENIYGNTKAKDRIHSSAIAVYFKNNIRGRDSIIFWNLYRSPQKTALKISFLEKLYKIICNFMKDNNSNI